MSNFTEQEIQVANKTARSAGAVGRNPVVIPFVEQIAKQSDRILDFGAGPAAKQTAALREKNLNVTAYDFGGNLTDFHDAEALGKQFDVVFASNVLNVQSSVNMLEETLKQIRATLSGGGQFIFNYPQEPRKLPELTSKSLIKDFICKYFDSCVTLGKGCYVAQVIN